MTVGSKNIPTKIVLVLILAVGFVIVKAQTAAHRIGLPMVSAHRGASKIAPENTIAAFRSAINLGANFIEIDVRTTSDGAQVIMHDGLLKRTTGLDARVDKTSLSTIEKLSAGQWFGVQYKEEKVPTLEVVCEFVRNENRHRDNKIKLYVDCKAITTGEVIRILNQYSLLDSAVFYGDLRVLKEIRKFSDKARLMPSFPGKEKMERIIRKVKPYAFDIPYHELEKETINYCHSKNVKVFSDLLGQNDTANSYKMAIALDVDLIQTDDVGGVLEVYKEIKQTDQ